MSLRRFGSRCATVAIMLALAVGVSAPTHAQSTAVTRRGVVRTDTLWAQSLGGMKSVTVYLPPSYAASPSRRYPVLFYLHGLFGDERNWVDIAHLDRTLDSLTAAGQPEAIVVMPDGDDGWYTTWAMLPDVPGCRADTVRKERADNYCVAWPHYDDYIARDLVAFVDRMYRTRADRAHRGIAGLSMGGYGAVTLALAYPDVFAAAASHSGILSPRLLGTPNAGARVATTEAEMRTVKPNLWQYMRSAFGRDTIGWSTRDPARMAERLLARAARGGVVLPKLSIDCGVDDQGIGQNREFHQTLLRLGVSHEYAEWPGAHTWSYWSTHASESLRFLLAVVATP